MKLFKMQKPTLSEHACHAPLRASEADIPVAVLCRYITPTTVSQQLTRLGVNLLATGIRRPQSIASLEELASWGILLGLDCACSASLHLILKEIVEFL
jgi:hypothetical protein